MDCTHNVDMNSLKADDIHTIEATIRYAFNDHAGLRVALYAGVSHTVPTLEKLADASI